MDLNAITSMIGSLGFPIACVIAMFWLQVKERDQHREDAEKWSTAINNNTLVMQRILDRLDFNGVLKKNDKDSE